MTSAKSTVAVLLAAGAGTRFRDVGHKLLAELPRTDDRPAESVVSRALSALEESGIGPIVVVTGAVDLAARLDDRDVVTVENAQWASGQMSSVRIGIEAARRRGAHRAVFGLADQPGVQPDAWRAIAAADAPIAVATYDGRRGNPVGLRSDVWELLPDAGDEGARALMRLRPDLVREVPCSGSPDDIDTVEDLRRWQNN